VHLGDLPVPDTHAANSAFEVAERFHSPALLHHCIRSYLWAAALGAQEGTPHDAELLYVAAMLHDIGLTAPFEHPSTSFEEVGGHVAYVFAAGASWPVPRRGRVEEIVARHMGWTGAPEDDWESHLLQRSTTI
jgi:HD superfamily phosphodiesterase